MYDVKKAETWPPGSMMQYKSPEHVGLGLVVANRNGVIVVFWDSHCSDPVCVYPVDKLNPLVISRAF